ncbi:MAG: tetratricopeptide repeat protein [Candidatus Eremiobacteraeota bacterium]|nr:tetratricopeptide repeat protein [Candidatus Eremiobacteraeota bacterium]
MINQPRGRGLPSALSFGITLAAGVVLVAIVGWFLHTGSATTGAALGPAADVTAPLERAAGNGVGGGTPAQAAAGPPAPVQRILTELRTRVARNPNDADALAGLAGLYADAGKFPQALPYYRQTLALRPNDARLRTDYASALHGSGDDPAARREAERVLRAQPDFEPARAVLRAVGG